MIPINRTFHGDLVGLHHDLSPLGSAVSNLATSSLYAQSAKCTTSPQALLTSHEVGDKSVALHRPLYQ